MVARDALILSAAEAGRGFSVKGADEVGHILARVVDSLRDFVRRDARSYAQLQWRNHETRSDTNLRPCGMVNGHKRQIIVVVNVPQFSGDANGVVAVVRHELVAADFVPFSRGRDLR